MSPDIAHCPQGAQIIPGWDPLFQTKPNQTKIGQDIWEPAFSFAFVTSSQNKSLSLSLPASQSCEMGTIMPICFIRPIEIGWNHWNSGVSKRLLSTEWWMNEWVNEVRACLTVSSFRGFSLQFESLPALFISPFPQRGRKVGALPKHCVSAFLSSQSLLHNWQL